ncbi:MAG: hypothetical protein Q9192_004438 [Flavoplaca navasiana]
MLPNPFSEEDAHRYIAEFKSWPHNFPPDQLVYPGFRSAPTAQYPDTARCYACSLVLQSRKDMDQPLSVHLSMIPACPIAREIQQSKTKIEEKIKQDTLAQIIKQREIRQENAGNALALPLQQRYKPSVERSLQLESKEGRLLHFNRKMKSGLWHISNVAGQGMPLCTEAVTACDILTYGFPNGLSAAITDVLREGGSMNGWFVQAIISLKCIDLIVALTQAVIALG